MRRALARGHVTELVPFDLELTDDGRVLPGLRHADGQTLRVGGHGRIGTPRGEPELTEVAEEGVRVTADDHVDALHGPGEAEVVRVLVVRHQHDLVDPDAGHLVDVLLRRFDLVEELGRCQRARRVLGLRRDVEPDVGHVLAIAVGLDDPRLDVLVRTGLGQRRPHPGEHVGTEDRCVAVTLVEVVEEGLEPGVGGVELVIAELEHVEADLDS